MSDLHPDVIQAAHQAIHAAWDAQLHLHQTAESVARTAIVAQLRQLAAEFGSADPWVRDELLAYAADLEGRTDD